jgi:hypothetical protein
VGSYRNHFLGVSKRAFLQLQSRMKIQIVDEQIDFYRLVVFEHEAGV